MINSIVIIGRLGKDPEITTTTGGKMVAKLAVATDFGYGDKAETTWHNVVLWEKLAEVCEKYLSKGRLVYVSGRQRNRSYTGTDGNTRYVSEIVANNMQMLDRGSEQGAPAPSTVPEDDVPF